MRGRTAFLLGLMTLAACSDSKPNAAAKADGPSEESTVAFLMETVEDGRVANEYKVTQAGTSPAVFNIVGKSNQFTLSFTKTGNCSYKESYKITKTGSDNVVAESESLLDMNFSNVSRISRKDGAVSYDGIVLSCAYVKGDKSLCSWLGANRRDFNSDFPLDRLDKALVYYHENFCPPPKF